MGMLQERWNTENGQTRFVFSSYFFSQLIGDNGSHFIFKNVARWTKKVEVFDLEQVLI